VGIKDVCFKSEDIIHPGFPAFWSSPTGYGNHTEFPADLRSNETIPSRHDEFHDAFKKKLFIYKDRI
jgi:hypothetical protein